MTLLLYSWRKSLQNPLDRRLGGLQSWSEHCGVEENLLLLPEIEPGHPACSILLYQQSYLSSFSSIDSSTKLKLHKFLCVHTAKKNTLSRVLYDAQFTISSYENNQNYNYLSAENQHAVHEIKQFCYMLKQCYKMYS
jgi:hypothetical protein